MNKHKFAKQKIQVHWHNNDKLNIFHFEFWVPSSNSECLIYLIGLERLKLID